MDSLTTTTSQYSDFTLFYHKMVSSMTVIQAFSTGRRFYFLTKGHKVMSGDVLSDHKWWGRGVGEHCWHLVGRDEGYCKYPIVHRAAPTTEGDPAPNVKGAEEKPWVQLAGREERGVSPAAGSCLALCGVG